jgi:transcriptional regulator with XRE-family HTH domain
VTSREKAVDRGKRNGIRQLTEIGVVVRDARLASGLSQASVARAARTSQTQVSRLERGLSPRISIGIVSQVLAVLGQRLSLKAYPEGSPVRDAGQLALLTKLRNRTDPSVPWRFEVPVTRDPDDLRAWDAQADTGDGPVRIEAETRLGDIQALKRRLGLKERDSPGRVILLVAGSHRNRRLLAEHGDVLRADFPLGTAAVLAALRAGRRPSTNGIVVL